MRPELNIPQLMTYPRYPVAYQTTFNYCSNNQYYNLQLPKFILSSDIAAKTLLTYNLEVSATKGSHQYGQLTLPKPTPLP